MDVGAIIVAVAGIVVSGVVGPLITTWVTRSNDTRKFLRESARQRRDELRIVLDEAAVLLSDGPRMLRYLTETGSRWEQRREADEWSGQVFPMRERLVLRLPDDHPVVAAYDRVREALTGIAQDATNEEGAIKEFERARNGFLSAARKALGAAVLEASS